LLKEQGHQVTVASRRRRDGRDSSNSIQAHRRTAPGIQEHDRKKPSDARRDEGPGIPDESLERVFEPFGRLESSRNRETGGTGLGLTIARDIAQAHGGTLTLNNRAEGGLTAELRLPRK